MTLEDELKELAIRLDERDMVEGDLESAAAIVRWAVEKGVIDAGVVELAPEHSFQILQPKASQE